MIQLAHEIERLDSLFNTYGELVLLSCRRELEHRACPDLTISLIPTHALHHILGCLTASRSARQVCTPAIAIGLLRQSVEALSLVDLGLQKPEFSEPLIRRWALKEFKNGNIRKALEKHVWKRYGNGLWDETWINFYAGLARAVQPYAHYSSGLLQWQMAVPQMSQNASGSFSGIAAMHPYVSDPMKIARIALFELLIVWVIGRLVIANSINEVSTDFRRTIDTLSDELKMSPLLFERAGWEMQFLPHIMFASS